MSNVLAFDLSRAKAIREARKLEAEADALFDRCAWLDTGNSLRVQLTNEALALRAKAARIRSDAGLEVAA